MRSDRPWDEIKSRVDKILSESTSAPVPSVRQLASQLGVPYETLRAAWLREFKTPLQDYAAQRQVEFAAQGPSSKPATPAQSQLDVADTTSEEAIEIDFSSTRSLDYVMSTLGIPATEALVYIKRLVASGVNLVEVVPGYWVQGNRPEKIRSFIPPVNLGPNRRVFRFGTWSDLHAGSIYCQPTALRLFLETAALRGFEFFMFGGDLTEGVNGYPGQNMGLLPYAQPHGRGSTREATAYQAQLAGHYIPKREGTKHFVLGGNHDMWHLTKATDGLDVFRPLTQSRDDLVFLGYDEADVPLTEDLYITLWHPKGGMSTSVTSAVQKSLASRMAQSRNQSGKSKMLALLAGHLHIESKAQIGNILVSQLGCFQMQTDFLVRGTLFPMIGGGLWDVEVDDQGLITRVNYEFIPFEPKRDDYLDYRVEPEALPPLVPAKVQPLYSRG